MHCGWDPDPLRIVENDKVIYIALHVLHNHISKQQNETVPHYATFQHPWTTYSQTQLTNLQPVTNIAQQTGIYSEAIKAHTFLKRIIGALEW